ncbi:hypothetical protein [Candidatus Uabimicrobium sp. HlEnr_7]|uniref:hypothetical protein n=1 Tax=Candidatus Uabimicrobium helgolandensis TaxID=3095367 RepID=UPI003555F663
MDVKQGLVVEKSDFISSSLTEIVDYRGDVTLFLDDNSSTEGYVFDVVGDHFHFYPSVGDKQEIPIASVVKIEVTGKDTAEGKSWEAWVAKKAEEQNK